MTNRLQIPEGVSDFYGSTAYGKRRVEAALRRCFQLRGYEEAETPSLEYFDTFMGEMGGIREESTIRFFDRDGRMMALRPDLTMPLARMVAALPKREGVMRYCYIGNAFGMQQEYGMMRREFTQAGCELFGTADPRADAEILITAGESLAAIGIDEFVLDLGHVGYLREICRCGGLNPAQTAAVAALIDEKNESELIAYCGEQQLDEGFSGQLRELIYLFGDESVFARARELFPIPGCLAIVDEMERICGMIRALGRPFTLSMDFAMAPNLDYYTGLVFRGMSPRLGHHLLSGGRYDNLLGQFGRPMPAVGFALGVGNALSVLRSMDKLGDLPRVDVLLGCGGSGEELFSLAESRRADGKSVTISYAGSLEEFQNEAERVRPKLAVFYRDGEIISQKEY